MTARSMMARLQEWDLFPVYGLPDMREHPSVDVVLDYDSQIPS